MLKRWLAILAILGSSLSQIHAQLSDNFADGDFTANPVWSGNTTDWVINATNQLQSNNSIANAGFYLSTPNSLAIAAQWEFYAKLAFNTSSANYVDVFLTATESDLGSATNTGYFVRLGGTADEICLYKKTTGGVITKIIDGVDAVLNTSNNTLKIKVIRDATNQFTLYRDLSGTGSSYLSEGAVVDATFTTSNYFGIYVKQSTASFFQKHFFTDFAITAYAPDTTPPILVSATATSNTTIDLLFNEPLDPVSSQNVANYQANNGIGVPASVILDPLNNTIVHVTYASTFPNGQTHTLTVNGIADVLGNVLTSANTTFFFYTPQQFDVVIDEIMADPTPQVALPNSEWIELRNTAVFPINLQGWRIGDANGLSAALPSFILKPDSLVIICTGSAVAGLSGYGNVIAVASFPSLDNTGEIIYLQSAAGNLIHAVHYASTWYQNELKQEGGWSLEMIDVHNPCSGYTNWRASSDLRGGTPGVKNSLDAINVDNDAPKLVRAYTQNSTQIVLVFDEPLDSVRAASINNYAISDGIGAPVSVTVLVPGLDRVVLQLATPLQTRKVYNIQTQNITDCHGNVISNARTARVGLSELADSLDIVLNELLFNPPTNGADFVEVYNRSNKIIDLSQVYLANRNSTGILSSIDQVYPEPYLFFPEEFLVFSENTNWVKSAYVSTNMNAFVQMNALPSYNDDESHVVVLNAQGAIVDEVFYSDKWHFKLIDNVEGVSLERIDYSAASNNAENWHSAATSVGYATPGYKNSQFRINDGVQGEVKVTPEIVTPDNDGWDDFAQINYQFPQAGYVANITLFDAAGRVVKSLQKNAVCGTKGSFRWDGLGDKNQQLPTGVYVVLTDVFNLAGLRKQFKNTIVVARRN